MDGSKVDKMSGMLRSRAIHGCENSSMSMLTFEVDQQIGQLYELMTAIRKQELEDNDPEHESGNDK
jgi:hypothetical protein